MLPLVNSTFRIIRLNLAALQGFELSRLYINFVCMHILIDAVYSTMKLCRWLKNCRLHFSF